jgi:hypothetical protein
MRPIMILSKTNLQIHSTKPTDPPFRRTIILDGFSARDFREMNLIYCCEQCSYFNLETKKCAMGFKVEKHMRENQLKLYNLTGKMAICRSQEID